MISHTGEKAERHSTTCPLVSVVIVHAGSIDDTKACVDSFLRVEYPSLEILVWDNGSAGNAAATLSAEYGARIRVCRSEQNLGTTGGYNAGVAQTSGTYIALMNNDTEVTPRWLSPLVKAMEDDPLMGACQPKVHGWVHRTMFDYAGAAGGFLDRYGFPFLRGRVFHTVEEDRGQYDQRTDLFWAGGGGFLVRRAAFQAVGGWDERLFCYMDEIDFCWRLQTSGYRIACIPESLIFHKGGQVWLHHPFTKRFYEHRNNLLILVKNLPFRSLITILPCRIIFDAIAFVYYLCTFQFPYAAAVFCAFPAFLVHAPDFLRSRLRGRNGMTPRSIIIDYFLLGRKTWHAIMRQATTSPQKHLHFGHPVERIDPTQLSIVHRGVQRAHVARYRFAAERVKGMHVLDVACGVGYGSAMMAAGARTVTGIDNNAGALQTAEARFAHPAVTFLQGNAWTLPLQDGQMDAVVSFETIEHLPADRIDQFLQEMHRVLRDGGLLLVSTPDTTFFSLGCMPGNPFHTVEFSRETLLSRLAPFFYVEEEYGQDFCNRVLAKWASRFAGYTAPRLVQRLWRMVYTLQTSGIISPRMQHGRRSPMDMIVVARKIAKHPADTSQNPGPSTDPHSSTPEEQTGGLPLPFPPTSPENTHTHSERAGEEPSPLLSDSEKNTGNVRKNEKAAALREQ